ncbi:MAG: hypothetical protein QG671_2092 [Actinomycetota bacterium]|nr:hypothetical protein [Actinomycetota bacterium]
MTRKSVRTSMRIGFLAALTVGASLCAVEGTAWAYSKCERYASAPNFSGSTITGVAKVQCSATVPAATLHGRIKEDRGYQPDVVHDTESVRFTGSKSITVRTSGCQDDDHIYTEAQINGETPAQSSRREMQC